MLTLFDLPEKLLQGASTPCGITIDAYQTDTGKARPQRLFQSLGALTQRPQLFTAALRTVSVYPTLPPAVVATEQVVRQMERHARIATFALCQIGRAHV